MFKINSAKSPSLSEEHFTSINGSKASEKMSFNELSMNSSKTSSHNNSKTMYNNDSSQNNSNMDEDDRDDSYDKSSTLKAAIQLNNVLNTSGPKPINRFNSDKSIYYSSVSF